MITTPRYRSRTKSFHSFTKSPHNTKWLRHCTRFKWLRYCTVVTWRATRDATAAVASAAVTSAAVLQQQSASDFVIRNAPCTFHISWSFTPHSNNTSLGEWRYGTKFMTSAIGNNRPYVIHNWSHLISYSKHSPPSESGGHRVYSLALLSLDLSRIAMPCLKRCLFIRYCIITMDQLLRFHFSYKRGSSCGGWGGSHPWNRRR